MRDLIGEGGGVNRQDLSKRMADNVVQTLVAYMQAPGSATAEAVHAYSTALSSLSLLAIAEQLQALAVALEPDDRAPLGEFECTDCGGTGQRVWGDKCRLCNGTGQMAVTA